MHQERRGEYIAQKTEPRHDAAERRRRLLAVVARGGAYTFGGGSGSRTGSGRILSRTAFKV
jgi:hypothetical protein